ncbi:MAG: class I SAM-dependent methyltransferase [Bifidobacteriaceae bacterium]|jgi:ubiquinone/menaquinone biosynthesis C-methylase UbiE|nr:class I SAM-dependent methyltransferase [Bifidobacteriaceae bacterium]
MIAGYGSVPCDERPDPEVAYWEVEAEDYYEEHGQFLGDERLVWCPEGLDEAEVHLLGDVAGVRTLEIGCGAAQGSRWAAAAGARAVGIDLSAGMLRVAARLGAAGFALVQSDAAALPFADQTFDLAFTAMGALPFVPSLAAVHREVARVLRPGGRWVFSTDHPLAWVFPDSPDPELLTVTRSYFNRQPYFERSDDGRLRYTQYHATLADHVTALVEAGFTIDRLIEPEWPDRGGADDGQWGAWSRDRGRLVPSTLIIAAHLSR